MSKTLEELDQLNVLLLPVVLAKTQDHPVFGCEA